MKNNDGSGIENVIMKKIISVINNENINGEIMA